MRNPLLRSLGFVITTATVLSGCGLRGPSAFETFKADARNDLVENLIVGPDAVTLYSLDESGRDGLPYVGFQTAATLATHGTLRDARTSLDRWDESGWESVRAEALIPNNFIAFEYVRAHNAAGSFGSTEQEVAGEVMKAHLSAESATTSGASLTNVVDHYINTVVVRSLTEQPEIATSLASWATSHPLSCTDQEFANGSDGYIAEMVYLGDDGLCDTDAVSDRFDALMQSVREITEPAALNADTCSAFESLALVATTSDEYELSMPELTASVDTAIAMYRLDISADPDICTSVLSQAQSMLGGTARFDPSVIDLLKDVALSGNYPQFAPITDDQVGALLSLLDFSDSDRQVAIDRYEAAGRPLPPLARDSDGSESLDFKKYPISTYLLVSQSPEKYCQAEVSDLDGSEGYSPLMGQLVDTQLIVLAKICGGGVSAEVDALVDNSVQQLSTAGSFVSSTQWVDLVTICSLSGSDEDRSLARATATAIVETSGNSLSSISILTGEVESTILLADIERLAEGGCE